MKIEINGKNYKLISVYPDAKFREKDIFLLEHESGYKTCFFSLDLKKYIHFDHHGIGYKEILISPSLLPESLQTYLRQKKMARETMSK